MITVLDNVFRLTCDAVSYVFRVTPFGHLEHLHFGGRIDDADVAPLAYKHALLRGDAVRYDEERDDAYCLYELPLEWSGSGKGDFRVPPLEAQMPDGSFTNDFLYQSHRIVNGAVPMASLPTAQGDEAVCDTLIVTLKDAALPVWLDLFFTVYPQENVITRRAVLRNDAETPMLLKKCLSYCLDLENDGFRVLTLTGAWASEAQPTVQPLSVGVFVNETTFGTSTHRSNPALLLMQQDANETTGAVYGFNLLYSGNHHTAVELLPTGQVRVVGGVSPHCFLYTLEAGASFETPESVLTYSENGLNGLRRSFHAFVSKRIVRGDWQNRERPVLINNWEADFFDFRQGSLLRLARRARKLGVELFVLDDGWFGARNTDHSGLGDYTVNRKKLPQGVTGLSKRIHAMGMRFGLWFEPESVNPDSDLYRAHPDWAIARPNRKPSLGRHQLILDLTNPAVRDYLVQQVSAILDDAHIDYVKWDMNRPFSDFGDGMQMHRYILGLYDVLERIFRPRPHILLEGCASGGGRFDLGMLCFAQQIWASDNTDPVTRLSIQTGLSYFYPQSCWGAHVSQSPHQQTLRSTPLFTRFAVAAFGAFGLELDIKDLKPIERRELRRYLDWYKAHRRTLQFGTFRRIDSGDPHVYQWQAGEGDDAVVLWANTLADATPPNRVLRVLGCKPQRVYACEQLQEGLDIDRFGGLLKHVLPVKLKANGLVLRTAGRYASMPDCRESYRTTGAVLSQGIRLQRAFIATGYSKNMHMQGDFAAQLYAIKGEES